MHPVVNDADQRSRHPKRTLEQQAAETRLADVSRYDLPPRVVYEDRPKLITLLDMLHQACRTHSEPTIGAPIADFLGNVEYQVVCVEPSHTMEDGGPAPAPLFYEVSCTCPLNTILNMDELQQIRAVDVLRLVNFIVTAKYTEKRLVIQFHLYSTHWQPPNREVQRQVTTILFVPELETEAQLQPRRLVRVPAKTGGGGGGGGVMEKVKNVFSVFT